MKVLVIPDIHGNYKAALKNIEEHKDEVDKVVVLGDYVDDFDESLNGKPMVDGFSKLMEYKKKEPEKFDILFGNHCLSYISQTRDGECVSGHHKMYARDYRKMFEEAIDLVDIISEIDGVLFSHAGVSQNWLNKVVAQYNCMHENDGCPLDLSSKFAACSNALEFGAIFDKYFGGEVFSLDHPKTEDEKMKANRYREIEAEIRKELNSVSLEMKKYSKPAIPKATWKCINQMFHSPHLGKPYNSELFEHCSPSPSGDFTGESCVWIRPKALLNDDWPKGIKCQIVGHTETCERCYNLKGKRLIILDSPNHDLFKIIDTESIDKIPYEVVNPPKKANSITEEEKLLLMLFGM